MSKIEELFGVKIGEKFTVQIGGTCYTDCYFDESGALVVATAVKINELVFDNLKRGTGKIVKQEKPKVLDEVETRFIGNIIRPFKLDYIQKISTKSGEKRYFIDIVLKNGESIDLPYFSNKNKMYVGMKPDKKYTPEQLGIKL